jgi:TonB-dependent receptor
VNDRKIYGAALGVALFVAGALAQAQTAPAADSGANAPALEEVVVTGYRKSLNDSTDAKKANTGFSDSIFAEDIGKFPDTNVAESFNRIPGITISRDINGQGQEIAIRGLGTNFTKILLNNAPVAVASTGAADAQSTNREVDLDLFPTELFTQLTVKKSATADMIEGGTSGTVNMRSARPFDNPGAHLVYDIQGTKNQKADKWGEHGSIIASKTFDSGFGALVGFVGVQNKVRTTGFETIGWTNPNLSTTGATPQCVPPAGTAISAFCNTTGGGNFGIPALVPANAGNGLTTGAPIDQAFLLAHNPGLSITQIDNAIIPRLGRTADENGTQNRYNGIVSLEYRPSDALHLYLDSIYGKKHNDERRFDMNWVGRNGAVIPLNETVDKSDCTNGCTVTSGTFANSQFFLEYRPYIEDTKFYSANPGLEWQVADIFKVNADLNKTHSTFHREVPTVLPITPASSGLTVTYNNDGGIPSIQSNVDLNNPASFGWAGGRVNIQDEYRTTDTKGAHLNFTLGKGGPINLQFGAAYDDILRRISGTDNSQAWQNAVCGDNPSVFVPGPNSQPPCQGLSTAAPGSGYPTYPGLGTNYTAGMPATFTYRGSVVPAASLANYLSPGPDGFVVVNWPLFASATNYQQFHDSSPASTGTNTGANGGFVEEKVKAAYVELTGDTTWGGNRLRYDLGLRFVRTGQTIGGYVSVADPRNANPAILDGGKYPNIVNFVYTQHDYNNTLPSGEIAYNVADNAVVKVAASRTMTRPDPSAMLPGVSFSDPSALNGTRGNPALNPFLSENLDFGFEYYTGQEGLVGVTVFRKRVTGFTIGGSTTLPFSDLAQYGINYDTLTPTQQAGLNSRGGPSAASVILNQQVNASGALTINGLELDWVQPLDFLLAKWGLEGFGINANYTLVDQIGTGAAPAIATGVSPHTYNVAGYYDHGPFTFRLATVYYKGSQTALAPQNGIQGGNFASDYRQWDFSSIWDISKMAGWSHEVQITADVVNIFQAKQRQYFQFPNATFTLYDPGRQYFIGIRGKF